MKTLKLLPLISLLALSSCAKDPCIDVTCLNDGVCDDGSCLCADWYEGEDCGTEQREKMLGDYLVNYHRCDSTFSFQSATSSYGPYIGVLSKGTDINQFVISHFSVGSGSISGEFMLLEDNNTTYSASYNSSDGSSNLINGEYNIVTSRHRMEWTIITSSGSKQYYIFIWDKI